MVLVGDELVAYTIDGIQQYLEIGGLKPRDVAMFLEPRYEDQNLPTGEYYLSTDEQWTIGVHVRPLEQLKVADFTYNADITVELTDIETDVFLDDVSPAFVDRFEDAFGAAELQYLDPDQL